MSTFAWSVGLVLVGSFVLGLVEKFGWLRRGASAWHPVLMKWRLVGPVATVAMTFGLVADVGCVMAIVANPEIGGAVAAGVIALYTTIGWQVVASGQSCRCLGSIGDTSSRAGLLVRNAILVGFAVVLCRVHPVWKELSPYAIVEFTILSGFTLAATEAPHWLRSRSQAIRKRAV